VARLRRFDRCELARLELPSGATCLLHVAEMFTARLLGLAGMVEPPEHGLLIPRCRSVHTSGMRFSIDVVFLGWPPCGAGRVRVLDVRHQVPPGRVVRLGAREARSRRAVAVVELRSEEAEKLGVCRGMEVGLVPEPRAAKAAP
jgi:uncharacterized protein